MARDESIEPGIAQDDFQPLIEFIHVVGYFRSPLSSPLSLARSCVEIVSDGFGGDQIGPKHTDALVVASTETLPSPDWQRNQAGGFTLLPRRVAFRDCLAHEDVASVDQHIDTLLLLREQPRPGRLRRYNFMWSYHYESETVFPNHQYDSKSMLSVRSKYFFKSPDGPPKADASLASQIVRQCVSAMVAAGDAYHIIVTCSPYREDAAGKGYYNIGGPSNHSSLRFQIEQDMWNTLGVKRREKVRGVYWGQYYSAWHLERLGGKQAFLDDYLALAEPRLGWRTFVQDFPGAGLFIKLTPSPMNYSVRGLDVPCGDLGVWLYQRCQAAGLLM